MSTPASRDLIGSYSDSRLELPRRAPGRPSTQADDDYAQRLVAWCRAIRGIHHGLDFTPGGVRGWCYLLEARGLSKGDFDRAEDLISHCRKLGLLPLNICAADPSRVSEGGEHIDVLDVVTQATAAIEWVQEQWQDYRPISFWEDQPYIWNCSSRKSI